MADNIDQTLSLNATLKNNVTPELKKINEGLKTTQGAMQSLNQQMSHLGDVMGGAAEASAARHQAASDKINADLSKTGQSFQDLERTAQDSSKGVGNALSDALYNRGSAQRLNELDKELGGLKNTFMGLASTAQPMSQRAGKMKAMGKDTLNRRVIPAFQKLHETLDDFPDTLRELNALETDRLEHTEQMGNILERVNQRVSGFGDRIRALKLNMEDFANVVMGTLTYRAANDLQARQRDAGQLGGLDAFFELPKIIRKSLQLTKAPIETWEGALDILIELDSVSHRAMPRLLKQFVELSKYSGESVEVIATLQEKLVSMSGLREGDFGQIFIQMSNLAKETRISMDELVGSLQSVTEVMAGLGQEAKRAYAEALLTSKAALKEQGLEGVTNVESYLDAIESSNSALAEALNAAQLGGLNPEDFLKMMAEGRGAETYDYAIRGIRNFFDQMPDAEPEQKTSQVEAARGLFGQIANPNREMLGQLRGSDQVIRDKLGLKEGTEITAAHRDSFNAAIKAAAEAEARGIDAFRGVIPETREQLLAQGERAKYMVGEAGAPVIQNAQQAMLNFAETGMNKLEKWDAAYDGLFSKAAAYYSLAAPLKSLIKSIAGFLGIDSVAGFLDTKVGGMVGTALSAVGINKFFGAETKPLTQQERMSTYFDTADAESYQATLDLKHQELQLKSDDEYFRAASEQAAQQFYAQNKNPEADFNKDISLEQRRAMIRDIALQMQSEDSKRLQAFEEQLAEIAELEAQSNRGLAERLARQVIGAQWEATKFAGAAMFPGAAYTLTHPGETADAIQSGVGIATGGALGPEALITAGGQGLTKVAYEKYKEVDSAVREGEKARVDEMRKTLVEKYGDTAETETIAKTEEMVSEQQLTNTRMASIDGGIQQLVTIFSQDGNRRPKPGKVPGEDNQVAYEGEGP